MTSTEITKPQWEIINEIETNLGIKFDGTTLKEASKFIGKYRRKLESVKVNG